MSVELINENQNALNQFRESLSIYDSNENPNLDKANHLLTKIKRDFSNGIKLCAAINEFAKGKCSTTDRSNWILKNSGVSHEVLQSYMNFGLKYIVLDGTEESLRGNSISDSIINSMMNISLTMNNSFNDIESIVVALNLDSKSIIDTEPGSTN
jgi:hypothetical protein